MHRSLPLRAAPRALAALALLLSACSDDSPTEPGAGEAPAELSVDASRGWSFVALGEPARVVSVADPSSSGDWDLAFHATGVMLNGGAAGPGGVEGYCLCQNSGASDAQVVAMSPASELDDFLSVTAAQIPADTLWRSDALVPAIRDWYAYDPVAHRVSADTTRAWLVRTAESTPSFARLRVLRIENATREHAGTVTLQYALQPAAGAAMGETRTLEVDLSAGGRAYVDLVRGALSDASDWDVALEGYTIRVNGGVSGSGTAGAVATADPFASIEDAGAAPASVYRGDAYGGAFDAARWYRYNLQGNHQIWPVYHVYLIRRGSEVYKVQLTGYYGPGGEPQRVTFRYARLTD